MCISPGRNLSRRTSHSPDSNVLASSSSSASIASTFCFVSSIAPQTGCQRISQVLTDNEVLWLIVVLGPPPFCDNAPPTCTSQLFHQELSGQSHYVGFQRQTDSCRCCLHQGQSLSQTHPTTNFIIIFGHLALDLDERIVHRVDKIRLLFGTADRQCSHWSLNPQLTIEGVFQSCLINDERVALFPRLWR